MLLLVLTSRRDPVSCPPTAPPNPHSRNCPDGPWSQTARGLLQLLGSECAFACDRCTACHAHFPPSPERGGSPFSSSAPPPGCSQGPELVHVCAGATPAWVNFNNRDVFSHGPWRLQGQAQGVRVGCSSHPGEWMPEGPLLPMSSCGCLCTPCPNPRLEGHQPCWSKAHPDDLVLT